MMRYVIDHDLHIHSYLSSCSGDATQTPARILQYAQDNRLSTVCLTDHFWDETVAGASNWYAPQNTAHIRQALPLPQTDKVRFLFGCETDMDKFFRIGISRRMLDELDFIIIPTTHLHMRGFTLEETDTSLERRAVLYVQRLQKVLSADLPFHKVGIAHLTCSLMAPGEWEQHLTVLDMIPDTVFADLFDKAAAKGVGIELNFSPARYTEEQLPRVLRPYEIAKTCGCRFYLGSDVHKSAELDGIKARFEAIVDALDLTEDDKWALPIGH